MYNDIESDFWKEIFVHMQHKNMVRVGAERLALADCEQTFERFNLAHPEIQAEVTNSSSYKTWEIFITDTIKLRLFIQTQIKGTLLQRDRGDLVKIADAKFPNNPFPEIEEFLSRKNDYLKELHHKLENGVRQEKLIKLTGEFIKAYLIKHFTDRKDVIWTLEPSGEDFKLTLTINKTVKTVMLSCNDYKNQIEEL